MTTLNEIPFIRILLPFLFGIVCYLTFQKQIDLNVLVTGLLIVTCIIWIVLKKNNLPAIKLLFGISSQLFLIVFGYHLSFLNNEKNSADHYSTLQAMPEQMIAQVVTIPVKGEKTTKAELQLRVAGYNDKAFEKNGRLMGYFQNSEKLNLNYGDVILIRSKLRDIEGAKNPGGFDYKEYLEKKNIFHSSYIKPNDVLVLNTEPVNFLIDFAIKIKLKLLAVLKENNLSGQELAIASSLLLGYDEEISNELSNAYAITGTIHVLSVSGLHIGIIYLMLNFMFGFLDKRKRGLIIKGVIVLSGVWIFAMISGLSPSVVRAAVMFSLFIFGKTFRLQTNVFNTLLASAFLILLYDPYLISDIGFQLSYLALGGILFFQPKIYEWFLFENKFADKVWALCSVSLAAQLTTFPITLYYFHNFSISFLLANLIIIPLSTLIMYGGIFIIATSFIPIVSSFFAVLISYMIQFMNGSAIVISKIPGSHLSGIYISLIEMLVIYLTVTFFCSFFMQKRKQHLYLALIMVISLLVSFNLTSLENSKNSKLVVYHHKEKSCIDIYEGNNFVRIGENLSDAESLANQSNATLFSHLPLCENVIYTVNGFSFVAADKIPGSSKSFPQMILLKKNIKVKIKQLAEAFPNSTIVADGTNKFSRMMKWKNAADSLHLKFWSTYEDGAYINSIRK